MFYTYNQNNSGGSFITDDSVAGFVIIEADSGEEADSNAEGVGIYFDSSDDCDCCGARWYSSSWSEGSEVPEIYGQEVVNGVYSDEYTPWTDPAGYIHYKDGRTEAVTFREEKQ